MPDYLTSTRHSWYHLLTVAASLLFTCIVLFAVPVTDARGAAPVGTTVKVVLDDNYPPYVNRDASGALQGILVDQWRLWEQKTGARVELYGMDWGDARRRMEAGDFDVIDTIFKTPQRQSLYDFSPPYARLEVPIFFHRDIAGIAGIETIKGFPVAVKSGDAVIDVLKGAGIDSLLEYPSYEEIIKAAAERKVNVFVVDKPPALYFLHKYNIADNFRQTAPLSIGEFHRAVRKGNAATLALVTAGFSQMSPAELNKITNRWSGTPAVTGSVINYILLFVAASLAVILLFIGWNYILRRQVRTKTLSLDKEIQERIATETSLHESELKYRSVVEYTDDLITSVDSQGRIRYVNQASQRYWGLLPDKCVGSVAFDFIHSDDRDKTRAAFEQWLEGDSDSFSFENRQVNISGAVFDMHWNISAIRDDAGNVREFACIARNVTERKQVEKINLTRLHFMEYAVNHSLDEFLTAALDEIEALTGSEIAFCHFVEADQNTLTRQAWSTQTLTKCRSRGVKGEHYTIEQGGAWTECIRERHPVIHNDYAATARRKGHPDGHIPVQRLMVVPVVRGRLITAIIGLGNKTIDYTDADTGAASLLADIAWETAERKLADDSLRYARFTLDQTLESIFWIDEHARIRDVNETACRNLGYSREEMKRLTVFDIDPVFPRDTWPEHWQKSRHNASYMIESVHQSKNGQQFPVEISLCVFEYAGQTLHCALARDITERKRGEEQLVRRTQELSALNALGRYVGSSLSIEEVLQSALKWTISALAPDVALIFLREGESLSLRGFMAKDASHAHYEAPVLKIGECLCGLAAMTGEPLFSLDIATDDRCCREECKKAGIRSFAALPLHGRDMVIGVVAIASFSERDFAAQSTFFETIAMQIGTGVQNALLYEKLQQSSDNYKMVVSSISTVVWNIELDDNQRIVKSYFSAVAERLLGLPEGAFEGDIGRFIRFVHPDDLPSLHMALREAAGSPGHQVTKEYRVVRSDGIVLWFRSSAVAQSNRDGLLQVIGTTEDVTERRQLEEQVLQQQKLESIGQLTGGIAHDFNNLLTPIIGYAEILKMSMPQGTPSSDRVDHILKASGRAKDLVRQLLNFSRKQPIATKPHDLNEIISSFNSILRGTVRENIEVRVALSPHPCPVQADLGQIQQVLLNFVVNSQDAIAENGIITVETGHVVIDDEYSHLHPGRRPGRYIMLAFSDSGCGIDDATLSHLFEPFFTTKPTGKGTGLGLSTVYGIVKQHEGFIDIQSRVGEGTTFRVYLPEREGTGEHEVPLSLLEAGQHDVVGTILLVEDNKMVLELARELLESRGHTVLAADNPNEALAIAGKHHGTIDLLVTDVIMPQMSGPELHGRLEARIADVRVLYISGYTSYVDVHKGQLVEGVNFLSKPFSSEVFLERVAQLIHSR